MPSFKAFADFQKSAKEAAASVPRPAVAEPPAASYGDEDPTVEASTSSSPPLRSPPRPQEDELRIGMHVRVRGLQARPELNGLEGVLTYLDEPRSRWQVELRNGGGAKLFKVSNLEQVLSDQDALDILKGRVKGPQASVARSAVGGTEEAAPVVSPGQAGAYEKALDGDRGPEPPETRQKSFLASGGRYVSAGGPSAAAIAAAAAVAGAKAGKLAAPSPPQQSSGADQKALDAESQNTADDEDDDEAFVRSIEQCLKECDVMWDDY